MATQLALLPNPRPASPISKRTREIGLRGLAEARAALHSVPRRRWDDEPAPERPAAPPAGRRGGNGPSSPGIPHPAAA